MKSVRIETSRIIDWTSFHELFKETFSFPEFYGENLDAWIDCMSYLDEPDSGMTAITVDPGELLILEVPEAEQFKKRSPEQFAALIECSAFVNCRRVESGDKPVLALLLL